MFCEYASLTRIEGCFAWKAQIDRIRESCVFESWGPLRVRDGNVKAFCLWWRLKAIHYVLTVEHLGKAIVVVLFTGKISVIDSANQQSLARQIVVDPARVVMSLAKLMNAVPYYQSIFGD